MFGRSCTLRLRGPRWLAGALLLLGAGRAQPQELRRPRAALVADVPLPPPAAVLSVMRGKLATGYALLEDGPLARELAQVDPEPTAERVVQERLREAQLKMRRLELEDVLKTLREAEPYVQQLPPTQSARALLCAVALRKAHAALLLDRLGEAEGELSRVLSVDPTMTLDQAQEPPPLLSLFERVKGQRGAGPAVHVKVVTNPPGAMLVLGGVPRGQAPMEVVTPAGQTTLWAQKDGFQPRNVTVTVDPATPISVQVQLEPLTALQQVRPLIDAFRGVPPGEQRTELARTLASTLRVDALLLAQAGPGGRPRLFLYGALPAVPSGAAAFEWIRVDPLRRSSTFPPWAWALTGALIGAAVTAGVAAGVVVSR